jgi:hypothetical protein
MRGAHNLDNFVLRMHAAHRFLSLYNMLFRTSTFHNRITYFDS